MNSSIALPDTTPALGGEKINTIARLSESPFATLNLDLLAWLTGAMPALDLVISSILLKRLSSRTSRNWNEPTSQPCYLHYLDSCYSRVDKWFTNKPKVEP